MTENEKIFSKEESCLSLKVMMDYTHDRLAMKERNRVEKHLLHCEMCSDAMEGLASVHDEKRVEAIIHSINGKVVERTRERFEWRRLAAVLVGALFIGGGLIYFITNDLKQSSTSVAVQKGSKNPSLKQEIIISTDSSIAIAPQREEFLNGYSKPNSDGAIYSFKVDESERRLELNNIKEGTNLAISDTFKTEQSLQTVAPAAWAEPMKEKKDMKGEMLDEVIVEKEEDKNLEYYSNKSINSSEVKIEKAKKANARAAAAPSVHADSIISAGANVSSDFDKGLKLYTKGEYQKATKYFEKLSNTDSNYEEARWYLAKSYLVIEEKEKAKVIFKEIVELNGMFKVRAEEELKKF